MDSSGIGANLIKEFQALAGAENVMTGQADLAAYTFDAAVTERVMPGLAVRPVTEEILGGVVALCHREGLPLTVRGSGTNLSGGTVPKAGGVVLITGGLNRIIELNRDDMYAVVQPGLVTARFAAAAEAEGLFYPPDPGSQAVSTLGGNVAENSGGLRGLKYGVTRNYVLGLEYFDSTGQLIKAGSRTVKCATGYNLAGLMVGSEGTLGVFSRLILRLVPPPAAARAMTAAFPSTEAASAAVSAIIAARIIPATLEFMDNFTIQVVEDYAKVGLPVDAGAMLLIEVDGHPAQVADEADRVEAILNKMGASAINIARDAAQRDAVWEARRSAIPALARLKPTLLLEDATVPRSRIPEMVAAIEDIARRHQVLIGTFGHAGDGNLHPSILCDKRDPDEWARVQAAVPEIFAKALELEGTISGEHGVGLSKREYLEWEVGRATLDWCRALKGALDPKNILNPEKVMA